MIGGNCGSEVEQSRSDYPFSTTRKLTQALPDKLTQHTDCDMLSVGISVGGALEASGDVPELGASHEEQTRAARSTKPSRYSTSSRIHLGSSRRRVRVRGRFHLLPFEKGRSRFGAHRSETDTLIRS